VAIVVDSETRLVVQGITGREGSFHTLRNRAYGTNVVAGVTPGKGGGDVEGIPVFDTVAAAVEVTAANASLLFVPARFAADALSESAGAGISTIICISEGLPAHDMLQVYGTVRSRGLTRLFLLGPTPPILRRKATANLNNGLPRAGRRRMEAIALLIFARSSNMA